jgi:hypothetical protein
MTILIMMITNQLIHCCRRHTGSGLGQNGTHTWDSDAALPAAIERLGAALSLTDLYLTHFHRLCHDHGTRSTSSDSVGAGPSPGVSTSVARAVAEPGASCTSTAAPARALEVSETIVFGKLGLFRTRVRHVLAMFELLARLWHVRHVPDAVGGRARLVANLDRLVKSIKRIQYDLVDFRRGEFAADYTRIMGELRAQLAALDVFIEAQFCRLLGTQQQSAEAVAAAGDGVEGAEDGGRWLTLGSNVQRLRRGFELITEFQHVITDEYAHCKARTRPPLYPTPGPRAA